jgi:HSP90 family molecular chaperone
MPISFLHFDSAQRNNKNEDPFKSSFKLANSIRNVKKIYLKSAEIPCGFFNIRTPQIFSFILSSSKDMDEISQLASITYTPKQKTNYNLVVNTNHELSNQILNNSDSAVQEKLVKQAVDLAKLSQNLLQGEELTAFVKRSFELMN